MALLSTSALIGTATIGASQAQVFELNTEERVDGVGGGTQASPWNLPTGQLRVGGSATGRLVIEAGGEVTTQFGSLGHENGSRGEVQVTGGSSRWTITTNMLVGGNGSGDLRIEEGGTVTATGAAQIGSNPGSTGTAVVTGAGSSWQTGSNLSVGTNSTGTLQVTEGADITSGDAFVGSGGTGDGAASLTGAGSTWRSTLLSVGNQGRGRLDVENGASVETGDLFLGAWATGDGEVVVAGAGSRLIADGAGYLGSFGEGRLRIENGGVLETTGLAMVGATTSATGEVAVSGAGSHLDVTGSLAVGRGGGTGSVTVSDGGAVSAGGGITVGTTASSTGVLNIGAAAGGAAAPAGQVTAATVTLGSAAGRLVFNHTDGDYSFGAAISGDGNLDHYSGMTALTGANSFTGNTAITGGTLVFNGSLGDVTLGSEGTLGGTGTLGALTAGGRVAPGNSIGTLSSGPVTFDPGSVLAVEIAPDGSADLLDVTGTAMINGGRVEVAPQAGSYSDGQQFLILRTSGGVTGAFDSVGYAPGQTLAFFAPSLLTQGNDVLLQLDRNASDFVQIVTDPALGGTAAALNALQGTGSPGSQAVLQALSGLTETEVNEATRQLSGSGLTGDVQSVQLAGQNVLAIIPSSGGGISPGTAQLVQFALAETGTSDALDGLDLAAASRPGRLRQSGPRFWFEGLGGFGSRDAEGAADGQSRYYVGAAGGVVFPLGEELELGLALAGFGGQVSTDDGLAETDSTSLMTAVKLTWAPGPWQVSGGLGLAGHRFESERDVRFTGFDQTAEGERDGVELLGDLGVGYDWEAGAWGLEGLTVTPTAGLAVSWLYQEAWSESGAAGANLQFDSAETLSVQPRLGFGLASDFDLGEGLTFTPRGLALWVGRFGDETTDTTARFAGTTASWRVPGLDEPKHSAALGVGADLASDEGWALSAGYAGRFGAGAREHGFLLGGRIQF